ncbi:acyl carrier protein [Streptomyces mirabilis]|jgi:acyl carrier protein|uniref:acyl carrier protein n=1 Tax=Streptomyces TaxID=1883 RepID=UPI000765992F|nr:MULTISPECIES: acyl carrier protein [Streptomyces]KAF5994721.1 polyketide-8 synthase acyl carrier protein [Streptomyces sp. WAC00263]MCX4421300.1 acyl carrier protein [Streptomyces mirabilis]MCZ1002165.1 acyl carrier protein [Streptomyces mirabilis]
MSVEATFDVDELREMIADVLEVDGESITQDIDFIRDLGVDSLLAMELAVTLERHYRVKIESHEIADVRTLPDICALLNRKLRKAT